jgi:hypothetical protein
LGALAVVCVALLAVVTLSSCGEDSLTGVSRQAQGLAPEAAIQTPNVQDLKKELNLTPQQTGPVASALARFRSEIRHVPDDGIEAADARIDAVLNLVVRLSPVLEDDQFDALVAFLFEETPVLEQALFVQTILFISPEMVEEFADQHNLTENQESALLQAVETANEAYSNLQMQIIAGQISGQNIQTQAVSIQQQFVVSAQAALGPLYSAWTTFVQQERTEAINAMLASLSDDVNAEFQLLDRLLRLDAQQESQIQAAMQSALLSYQSLLNQINQGTVTFDQAITLSSQIVTTLNTSISATLTPSQRARYDAVSFLLVDPFGVVFI